MNKANYIIPAVALAVSGLLVYGTVSVKASSANNWRESLVSALANKLGVDQSKVQIAVNDIRSDNRAQAESRFETRLSELVTLGKITESQKQLLAGKRAELQKEWDSEVSQREEHQVALKKWASDNGIDLDAIGLFGMGMGRGMGEGRGMGRGGW